MTKTWLKLFQNSKNEITVEKKTLVHFLPFDCPSNLTRGWVSPDEYPQKLAANSLFQVKFNTVVYLGTDVIALTFCGCAS